MATVLLAVNPGFGFRMTNLRPFDVPAAILAVSVGLLCIHPPAPPPPRLPRRILKWGDSADSIDRLDHIFLLFLFFLPTHSPSFHNPPRR